MNSACTIGIEKTKGETQPIKCGEQKIRVESQIHVQLQRTHLMIMIDAWHRRKQARVLGKSNNNNNKQRRQSVLQTSTLLVFHSSNTSRFHVTFQIDRADVAGRMVEGGIESRWFSQTGGHIQLWAVEKIRCFNCLVTTTFQRRRNHSRRRNAAATPKLKKIETSSPPFIFFLNIFCFVLFTMCVRGLNSHHLQKV